MAKKIPSKKLSTTKKKIPSRKLSTTKNKLPSRKFAKGTAKIASRKFPKASRAPSKKIDAQALPDRPENDDVRQDRIATLKKKLKMKSLSDSK